MRRQWPAVTRGRAQATGEPAKGLKKYNEDNRRDRLLTDDELQRLMAALDTDPARAACLVIKWCLHTACRKGEALHLRFADVNWDNKNWTIQAANAKSKKRRVVPLNSGALGHANISTTEKYLHASGKSLQGGAASIENYLEKALAKKAS